MRNLDEAAFCYFSLICLPVRCSISMTQSCAPLMSRAISASTSSALG